MKKNIVFSIVITIGFFFSLETINAQVLLESYDCFSLKAKIDHHESNLTKYSSYTYSLEKLIAPSVWSEKDKSVGKEENVSFNNLSPGFYRVTYFPIPTKRKLVGKNRSVKMEAYISNTIEIKKCEGVENEHLKFHSVQNDLLIYPNPAKDEVHIVLPKTSLDRNYILQIQDVTGKVVKVINNISNLEIINVNEMDSGLYFITIREGEEILFNKKLVVNKN